MCEKKKVMKKDIGVKKMMLWTNKDEKKDCHPSMR